MQAAQQAYPSFSFPLVTDIAFEFIPFLGFYFGIDIVFLFPAASYGSSPISPPNEENGSERGFR